MIFTRKVSRTIFFLLFILTLSLSTVASTTQAATTTMLHTQRTHSGNMVPMVAGTVTEFSIPTPGSQPVGITSGPCGDGTQCLWFTESHSNKIGKIITTGLHTGQITEYSLPSSPTNADTEPEGITSGPCGDGTQCLWFTEFSQIYGNNIGKITTSGQITLYPIPTAKSEPESITSGPDGNLWFTEFNANNIGKITPGGQITEYAVPTANSEPASITSGPDGNLWFTEYMGENIGQITPGGQITEYQLPSPQPFSIANGITSGPDGKLWFSLIVFPNTFGKAQGTSKIGQIDPSTHVITESQSLPNPQCVPNAITTGSDGKLWFTEYYQIGTITIGDNITEYSLPSGSIGNLPDQITGGPDNNLWFTEFSGNNIGRITTN
ncbi:MAG TPA: Virginiamycin B lyase [Ktedonobacteraceae bacterium]|nr:Virginiamycin B lyase [Ktedonobacteraceae bacterium]